MEFIKIFDKVVAVDRIKYFDVEVLEKGVKVNLFLDDGVKLSDYKFVSKHIDLRDFAEKVMNCLISTINDLSDSQCEDIEDYLYKYYDDDEEEEEESGIITDSSQLYKLEKDDTGTYYTYYR